MDKGEELLLGRMETREATRRGFLMAIWAFTLARRRDVGGKLEN